MFGVHSDSVEPKVLHVLCHCYAAKPRHWFSVPQPSSQTHSHMYLMLTAPPPPPPTNPQTFSLGQVGIFINNILSPRLPSWIFQMNYTCDSALFGLNNVESVLMTFSAVYTDFSVGFGTKNRSYITIGRVIHRMYFFLE